MKLEDKISRAKRRQEKASFVKNNSPNHNSFKIYVSGEVIKQIESSNETQKNKRELCVKSNQ
jgi:hypothetical protein